MFVTGYYIIYCIYKYKTLIVAGMLHVILYFKVFKPKTFRKISSGIDFRGAWYVYIP